MHQWIRIILISIAGGTGSFLFSEGLPTSPQFINSDPSKYADIVSQEIVANQLGLKDNQIVILFPECSSCSTFYQHAAKFLLRKQRNPILLLSENPTVLRSRIRSENQLSFKSFSSLGVNANLRFQPIGIYRFDQNKQRLLWVKLDEA